MFLNIQYDTSYQEALNAIVYYREAIDAFRVHGRPFASVGVLLQAMGELQNKVRSAQQETDGFKRKHDGADDRFRDAEEKYDEELRLREQLEKQLKFATNTLEERDAQVVMCKKELFDLKMDLESTQNKLTEAKIEINNLSLQCAALQDDNRSLNADRDHIAEILEASKATWNQAAASILPEEGRALYELQIKNAKTVSGLFAAENLRLKETCAYLQQEVMVRTREAAQARDELIDMRRKLYHLRDSAKEITKSWIERLGEVGGI